MSEPLLLFSVPPGVAGAALLVLTLAHGLRLVADGDQRYAGHVALCALAGLLLAPITVWLWGG